MAQVESLDTILTCKRVEDMDNLSEWSQVWSTTHVPGMDMATGGGSSRRRKSGRRRLQLAAFTLGGLLTMHVRVCCLALTGGYVIFLLSLVPGVAVMGNPLRHFEVYLGQWSISGPGRAFRIIPMFDGIGVAICIHAIVRAILCVMMAAISAIYVMHSISDSTLPFTHCRDMNLKTYKPTAIEIDKSKLNSGDLDAQIAAFDKYSASAKTQNNSTRVKNDSLKDANKIPEYHRLIPMQQIANSMKRTVDFCKESYPNNYPPVYRTPAYNFFYVEVMHYRPDHDLTEINFPFLIMALIIWSFIWVLMIAERFMNKKMIWNNMYPCFAVIPALWSAFVVMVGLMKFFSRTAPMRNLFYIGGHSDILDFGTEVFMASAYIHAVALGSELIHGKGLNFYASGHIDPHLNSEALWHSSGLLVLTAMSTGGATLCSLTDYMHMQGVSNIKDSSLWMFPLYSKCAIFGNYAHFISTIIFTGLLFSYTTVAFVCLKSALHTIFEYRVKLVFVEQLVVAILILMCMATSVAFTNNAGLGLLESLDLFMEGIVTPLISAFEMLGLLYVYRGPDFISDMNVATEDNACSSRISIQWQILPFLEILLLIFKAVAVSNSELPAVFMWVGLASTFIVIMALPLRACCNAYHFMQPPKH